jgi:RNA polymerase sigma factor (TIGR02999 family)
MVGESHNITNYLQRLSLGDPDAEKNAFRLLYRSLRQIAVREMRKERLDHTLQPTALVNEAYLKLVGQRTKQWQNRAHFLAVASVIMRQVLVDYARRRKAEKHGGGSTHEPLSHTISAAPGIQVEILDLERALNRLTALDQRQGKLVVYKFFGGMTEEECADVLGVSVRTVRRDWSMARAWLYGELTERPAARAINVSANRP